MSEPERGTSSPAGSPFDKCAAAVVPPAKAVFSVPEAAVLDPNATGTRRSKGQTECCYAWAASAAGQRRRASRKEKIGKRSRVRGVRDARTPATRRTVPHWFRI
jgi:hypothetical protein